MKRILKKTLKIFGYTFLALFISLNLFIVLSGRFYLYKGFANTYLKGHSGPTIYDLDVFHNSTLEKADKKIPFVIHDKYNTQKIPADYRKYLEDLDTRAFIVMRDDTLIYEEYWDPHTETTVSNSFSVAKSVVAILLGVAIDEGKIKSLDDKVGDYITEFKGGKKGKITLRHLLQMSSGLDWTESGKDPLSDNAESYFGSNLYELVTRQKAIEEPGKRFNYQSGNSQLLGFVIEKATGKNLSEYAEEKLWKKLGTEHDAYWSLDEEGGDEKAFCCLYSTARDFARIGQLLLNKGKYKGQQIIPEWYYTELVTPVKQLSTDEGLPNYRYGLHFWTYFGNANPTYYCRGINGQYIITIPEENLVIIRIGEDRMPVYKIPEHLKNDKEYVEQNKMNVGHNLGLFQYIALAKMMSSQIE